MTINPGDNYRRVRFSNEARCRVHIADVPVHIGCTFVHIHSTKVAA
jgi:hypothetical protein